MSLMNKIGRENLDFKMMVTYIHLKGDLVN